MKKIAVLLFLSALVMACSEQQQTEPRWDLPAPDWLDSTTHPRFESISDVDNLWRGKKRCCIDKDQLVANQREFYAACYDAIAEQPLNEELVVKCLWLMDSGLGIVDRARIHHILVDNFPYHRNSIDNCANCSPGDTVARVTLDLARIEAANGDMALAVERLERLLDERGPEISLWVQTEIYTTLAGFYRKTNMDTTQQRRLQDAYEKLADARKIKGNGVARRFEGLHAAYTAVMAGRVH